MVKKEISYIKISNKKDKNVQKKWVKNKKNLLGNKVEFLMREVHCNITHSKCSFSFIIARTHFKLG